jgi:hypothetical protein
MLFGFSILYGSEEAKRNERHFILQEAGKHEIFSPTVF